ncbi:hypothetical protein ACFL3D_01985, partial [Candidatus Omnitrophota bacterium]
MKIALCSTAELYGGVEEWLRTFCVELQAAHDNISFFVILFHNADLACYLREKGVNVIILPKRASLNIFRFTD